jgi:putative inorganic carbon (hco3(-)) transporter
MLRDIAFSSLFLGVLALGFYRVNLCVLVWAWVSLLSPNFLFYGFASEIPYNRIVAGLTMITVVLALSGREKTSLYADRTSYMILAFLGLAALSQSLSDAISWTGWDILDKLWKIVLLNIIISSFMRSRVRLHSLVLAICISIGFVAAGDGLKFFLSGGSYRSPGSPSLGDNNHFAVIVLMIIPMLDYLREVSKEKLVRLGATAGMVLFVCSVISTTSRGGLIGLVVLGAAGILESRHKVRYIFSVAVLAITFLAIVPTTWVTRMDTIKTAEDDSSFTGRIVAWKMGALIALDRPLIGGGLHSLQSQNIWTAYSQDFYKLSFIPTDPPVPEAHATHSIYFEVLGDTGFTGLALYLAIMAFSFFNGSQIKAMARNHPDLRWAAILAGKLQLSLVVFAVSGAALSVAYNDINFMIFAMLTTIRAVVKDQVSQRTPSAFALRRMTQVASRPAAIPLTRSAPHYDL